VSSELVPAQHLSPAAHTLPATQVAHELDSPDHGLSDEQAALRLERDGPNALPAQTRSWLALVASQFQDVLVYVLLAALALAAIMPFFEAEPLEPGSFVDAAVIAGILVLNAALGVVQEYRAEAAIAALQAMSSPHARVRRAGRELSIPSEELVVGDRVLLDAGDRISADGRLITSTFLEVDESALTGESVPVSKSEDPVAASAVLAERGCMVHAGTLVTRGSAEAVVTATGTRSQVGRIAGLVATAVLPTTPLQEQLARLGRMLGLVAIVLVVVVVAVGLLMQMEVLELLLLGVSLAVSTVPEGLPAVVTVCFALGVQRMVRHKALVRRLDALETLGAVSVIATDKTGTLTENRMTVVQHVLFGQADVQELARLGASCNHAELPELGDPTELALLGFAQEVGAERLPIDEEVVPFTSVNKYMRTRHGQMEALKGAPERILEIVDAPDEDAVLDAARELASQGLRVLGVAAVQDGQARVVGLVGMEDPPRDGVAEALSQARTAGIRTVVVTGDHVVTARAIAERVGLVGQAREGRELDALGPDELRALVRQTTVFARVSPEHKVAICRALQAEGHVVAMTGDGVNDAPALKAAHVGVAMGERGTEVAREAASIVLADDHYATIVRAVAEGRRIHDNVRRFVLFLLRANFDEILLILTTLVLGWPLPFLPIQILWINLMTDGLPALALAAEQAEPDVMERPPRPPTQHLLHGEIFRLTSAAFLGFGAALGFFAWQLQVAPDESTARSATLTLVILLELLLALSSRTRLPLWRIDPLSNRWLLAAIGGVLGVHIVLLYTPLGALFHLVPIDAMSWGVAIVVALGVLFTFEGVKAARHWFRG